MQVDAIPAFDDNYIWLLTEPGSERCAVVDPGDEEPPFVGRPTMASGADDRSFQPDGSCHES